MLNLFANACILNRCAWILLQDLRSNNVYCIPKHWEHISHCISLGPWKLSIFVWERTEQQNGSNPISTLDGVTSQHSFFTPLVVVFPVFEYLPHLSPLLALFVVLKAGQGKKSFEDAEKAKLLLQTKDTNIAEKRILVYFRLKGKEMTHTRTAFADGIYSGRVTAILKIRITWGG